jgi:hypothetical protein
MTLGFLEQAAVGIGRRLMRLVRAPFHAEIDRRIPGIVGRVARPVFPFETLLAGPGLQQSAVYREMLGAFAMTYVNPSDDPQRPAIK